MADNEIAVLRNRVDSLSDDLAETSQRLAKASATLGLIRWFGGAVGTALIAAFVAGQIQISDVTNVAREADDLAKSALDAANAAADQLGGIETLVTQVQVEIQGALDSARQNAESVVSELAADGVAAAIGGLDGMVAVFGEDGCPHGWQDFEDGAGRVIVGVGQGVDEDGEPLTNRPFGEASGEEAVTLTEPTMPRHDHEFRIGGGLSAAIIDASDFDYSTDNAPVVSSTPSTRRHLYIRNYESNTDEAGGDQPHNNMPPYIALHFCEYVGSN